MLRSTRFRASVKPNSTAAASAPFGDQRPRIIAARAMYPRPAETSLVNASPAARKEAPPKPATAEPSTTARYRVRFTWIPTVSAAFGCSPTDRSEEHTSELQSRGQLVCRLLLEKKNWNGQTRSMPE